MVVSSEVYSSYMLTLSSFPFECLSVVLLLVAVAVAAAAVAVVRKMDGMDT